MGFSFSKKISGSLFDSTRYCKTWVKANSASDKCSTSYNHWRASASRPLKIDTCSFLFCVSLNLFSLKMTINWLSLVQGVSIWLPNFSGNGTLGNIFRWERVRRLEERSIFPVYMSDIKLAKFTAWTFRLLNFQVLPL